MIKITLYKTQSGAALITSMLILLVMTIIAIASMGSSTLEEKISSNYKNHKQAFFNAEAGVLLAIKQLANFNSTAINNSFQDVTVTPKTSGGLPVTWNGSAFSQTTVPVANLNNYVYEIRSIGKSNNSTSNNSTYEVIAEVARRGFINIPGVFYGITEMNVKDTAIIQGRDICAQENWQIPQNLPPNPNNNQDPSTTLIGLPSVVLFDPFAANSLILDSQYNIEGVMPTLNPPPAPTHDMFNGVSSAVFGYQGLGAQGSAITPLINKFSGRSDAKIFNLPSSGPPNKTVSDLVFDKPSTNPDGSCTENTDNFSGLTNSNPQPPSPPTTNNVIVINVSNGDTLKLKNIKGCGTLIIKGDGTGKVEFENNANGESQWNGLIMTTERIVVGDSTRILGSILSNHMGQIFANNEFKDTSSTSFCQAALNPILKMKGFLPPLEIISWRGNNL